MFQAGNKYKGYQSLSTDDTVAEGAIDIEDMSTQNMKVDNAMTFMNGRRPILILIFGISLMIFVVIQSTKPDPIIMKAAWSSKAEPLSIVDPTTLGFVAFDRPRAKPGPIFGKLLTSQTPLPTNSWYENFFLGDSTNTEQNIVFQVPYILDTGAHIRGVRTHPCHVQANDRSVMMTYEVANGVAVGASETFLPQNLIHSQGSPAISKLAVELEWSTKEFQDEVGGSAMRSPIVRGSPYTSMLYFNATPRVYADRKLKRAIQIDQGEGNKELLCGVGTGNYSSKPVLVEKEIKFELDSSDMTWLVFVSEPTEFVCSYYDGAKYMEGLNLSPGIVVVDPSYFDLKAVNPMKRGMIRVAMANNCTTGQNVQYCGTQKLPRDQTAYEALLRKHADIYPTAKADIEFTFPVESQEEEELRLIFNWSPAKMSNLPLKDEEVGTMQFEDPPIEAFPAQETPDVELLLFALPHHQERMRSTMESSNQVKDEGCMPTIHGIACPATGNTWSLVEHLHRTSFSAPRAPQPEMIDALKASLQKDLLWRLPQNYLVGAGDTYFSGKFLARLARILIIADEMGMSQTSLFKDALTHLRGATEIWLNGSAQSMFLYDQSWRGVIMCGCSYTWDEEKKVGYCANQFPDCPALSDMGQNFGAGFYNDHHYHFGYHIYAAAVVSKFDAKWGRKFHEHVLLLVRDIANPSNDDPFFPTWRHKDWFLGFSWASGIVTINNNQPYPNGRNQESVSEAIAAYEAVAMYGDVMSNIYFGSKDAYGLSAYDSALRMRDMGRLLMATEIRSAKIYWHVQSPDTPGVSRIYPDVYEPKVIGMMWSMLAQEQTWFGNEQWKSYGIQLLPITPASELRDDPSWVKEMLPYFTESCLPDANCVKEGWSVVIYTSLAETGDWHTAWEGVNALDSSAYESAGGNGHSMSNTLWYIATRP